MSSQEKRSKEPCVRCGDMVSVSVDRQAKVYCVDCKPKATASVPDASRSENPVKLSANDIMTVTCQLCRSSLLVGESKVGTKITCPDCHSAIVVQRPKSQPKRKTGRPQPKTNQPLFDPDAELALEEPAERLTPDRSEGLDDFTEDLLSAPLPEVDPLSAPDDESIDPQDADDLPDSDQALTRRQRYEKIQQHVISDGRKKMRSRARAKLATQKTGSKPTKSTEDIEDTNPHRKKRRRRRKGQGGRKVQSPSWLKPAFGWLRERSLIVGWVLSAMCLSVVYTAGVDWSPLDLLDRGYGMLTRSPLVWDVRLIVNSVLLVVGSLYLYFLCGRSFAMNAGISREDQGKSESTPPQVDASSLFTTIHFAMAWWLAGLPFLYSSILLLPVQCLIVAPLLVGSWLNRSVWKFSRADGLIDQEKQKEGRRLWRKFYGLQLVAAVISILPVWMIRSGGMPSILGCLLMGGIMIGMAGICGWHCRKLSNSVELSP